MPDRNRPPPVRPESMDTMLSTDERAFLMDFARAGVASQRLWRIAAYVLGGLTSIIAFAAAALGFAHLYSGK